MSNQPQQQALPPVKIAFIIDGKVIDILHTDDRLAAIFLSQPTIVDVTSILEANADVNHIHVGDLYDEESGIFSKPEIEQPTEE
jgi:hypothetical protein